MDKNFPEIAEAISANMRKLRNDIPDTMKGFSALAQAATRDGALDKKTKELIALRLALRRIATVSGFIPKPLSGWARRDRSSRKRSEWRSIWGVDRL